MSVLKNLKPQSVFDYFEKICGIPHGSGNTKKISEYLVSFAKEHGLHYDVDEYNNVIIYKNATSGYENSPSVILQGHMDMVCEKEDDSTIDFAKDGIELIVENDVIHANKTTLGGDDGIALAYILAILDSDDISHPAIEAVFTVDEEIGMIGASKLDYSKLSSKLMINLDSEDEGMILVSCAGGAVVTSRYTAPCQMLSISDDGYGIGYFDQEKYKRVKISINGLTGGHSGIEINKQRANANVLLGRVLYALSKKLYFNLVEVSGGLKDNAIPRSAYAIIDLYFNEDDQEYNENVFDELSALLNEYTEILKNEYRTTDSNLSIGLEHISYANLKDEDLVNFYADYKNPTMDVISLLINQPNGVIKYNYNDANEALTSLNLGIMTTDKFATTREVALCYLVRSNVNSEKKEIIEKIECLTKQMEGYVDISGEYPAWEMKKDSHLTEIMKAAYKDLFGEEAIVTSVHAGLECGIFSDNIKDLDCVSIGPRMDDIHTPSECLYIDSVKKYWDYIISVLEKL